jgi:hypothetical protein
VSAGPLPLLGGNLTLGFWLSGMEQILPQSFLLGVIETLSRPEQRKADIGRKSYKAAG